MIFGPGENDGDDDDGVAEVFDERTKAFLERLEANLVKYKPILDRLRDGDWTGKG